MQNNFAPPPPPPRLKYPGYATDAKDYQSVHNTILAIPIVLLLVYVQYGWMGSVCIAPIIVPKVEAGEWPVVTKVELGEQRVKKITHSQYSEWFCATKCDEKLWSYWSCSMQDFQMEAMTTWLQSAEIQQKYMILQTRGKYAAQQLYQNC